MASQGPADRVTLGGGRMIRSGSVVGGRYTVLRELGRGGMGTVCLVIQNRSGKLWAMKVLHLKAAVRPEAEQILRQEFEMMRRLRHPGLPELADVIEEDGEYCLVMTYIKGRSLQQLISSGQGPDNRPYGPEEIIRWGLDLCSIMIYLHERKPPVLYLDLKPSNVMLQADGKLYLVDLGASLILRHGFKAAPVAGTASYAPPELKGGSSLGPWSDVYSFGRLLQALVRGMKSEKKAESRKALKALEPVIRRCLYTCPGDRYRSFREVSAALSQIVSRGRRKRRRRQHFLIVGRTLLGMSLVFAAGSIALNAASRAVSRRSYESLTEGAEGLAEDDLMQAVAEAAALQPEKPQAYLLLIGRLSADGSFDAADLDRVRSLLYGRSGEGEPDHLHLLKRDSAAYGEVAYALGQALHEGSDDPALHQQADFWFGEMLSAAASLPETDDRLRIRCRHADLMVRLDESLKHLSGSIVRDGQVGDLWHILEETVGLAESSELTRLTRLHLLSDGSAALYDHASLFLAVDIKAGAQLAMLDRILSAVRALAPYSAQEAVLADRTQMQAQLAADLISQTGIAETGGMEE